MKGGVGKTTVSAHVMRVVFHAHRMNTLLVDLDPQFNLTQGLIKETAYDKLKAERSTVLQAFEPVGAASLFDVATTHQPPPNPSELGHGLRVLQTTPPVKLDLVPGDFELIKYNLVQDQTKLDQARQRFRRFISKAREEYDLVILDCNPSSSFLTICALQVCSHLLVPVRPDRYSMLGLRLVSELIDRLPEIHPKPKMGIIMNGLPRNKPMAPVEAQIRADKRFGPMVFASKLYQSKLLHAGGEHTGFATERPVPYRDLLGAELGVVANELQGWL